MIPLFSAQKANQGMDFSNAIHRVMNRHWYVLGEEVVNFEREFAQYIGVQHCITVANGTDALELALRGLGVAKNDRVVTVANAGFYSSTAIHAIGAAPLYIDVDEETLTMSPDKLEHVIHQKPKAVIVTHLYGQLADMDALKRLSDQADIPLVEDCAQAHGAQRDGQQAGSFGAVACFSFYPTKNLGALGDGGAIVTRDTDLAARIRALRQYGWSQKYCVAAPGGRNSRLDELQAAILREKLPNLQRWNAERRHIAQRYNRAFAALPLRCPSSLTEDYAAHLYVARIDQRDAFRAFLESSGIGTDVHYPIPDYRQPAYAVPGFDLLKVTEAAAQTVVSLPCFPGLTDDEVERVVRAVCDYFQQ